MLTSAVQIDYLLTSVCKDSLLSFIVDTLAHPSVHLIVLLASTLALAVSVENSSSSTQVTKPNLGPVVPDTIILDQKGIITKYLVSSTCLWILAEGIIEIAISCYG